MADRVVAAAAARLEIAAFEPIADMCGLSRRGQARNSETRNMFTHRPTVPPTGPHTVSFIGS